MSRRGGRRLPRPRGNADLAFHLAREHERPCPALTSQHNYDLTA
ncbi:MULTISPECIES: hypothetical protein [unclassified Streptomyces]|nr:hypothetical protein [Streptomyces sp. NBC_00243]WRZ25433.1 hypothetical protein OHT59_46350 [Streptomyces sp. NBC_00243]